MCSISSWAVATGTGISPDSRYSIPSLWLPTSWEDVMERSNMVIETESKRSPCTAKVIVELPLLVAFRRAPVVQSQPVLYDRIGRRAARLIPTIFLVAFVRLSGGEA